MFDGALAEEAVAFYFAEAFEFGHVFEECLVAVAAGLGSLGVVECEPAVGGEPGEIAEDGVVAESPWDEEQCERGGAGGDSVGVSVGGFGGECDPEPVERDPAGGGGACEQGERAAEGCAGSGVGLAVVGGVGEGDCSVGAQ